MKPVARVRSPLKPLLSIRMLVGAASAALLLWTASVTAHGDEAIDAPSAGPRELILSKPLQHALAITTTRLADARLAAPAHALAEVVAHPDARSRVQAPEAGRLLAVGAWPVAGRKLRRGELLAVLNPALALREQSQRRADLSTLEQRSRIARINVDRLQLQSSAAGGLDASGNTYLEQAVQESQTLQRQTELLQQSLAGRIEIRAGEDGVVQRAPAAAGEVVTRGQTLFEIAGGTKPMLRLRVYDAARIGLPASARLAQTRYALQSAGHDSAAPEAGWNLWLEFEADAPALPVGTPVAVDFSDAATASGDDVQRLPSASVQGVGEQAHVWLHVAPEKFQRRAVQVIAARGDSVLARVALAPTDRLVAGGAALLDQYR